VQAAICSDKIDRPSANIHILLLKPGNDGPVNAYRVHLNVEAVGIGGFVAMIPRLESPDLNVDKRRGSTPFQKVWTGSDHGAPGRRAIMAFSMARFG